MRRECVVAILALFCAAGLCHGRQIRHVVAQATPIDTVPKAGRSAPDASGSSVDYGDSELKSGPRKFSLQIGGGAAAFMGASENVLFNRENTGYIVASYLGFRFSRLRHSAGLFGTVGTLSGSTSRFLSRAYEMTVAARIDTEVRSNRYLDLEAGVMLWEKLRISAGPSWAWVTLNDGTSNIISLGTSTVGFQLRTGPVRWFVNGTTYFNKDFQQFFVRPSAGVAIQFYMIRFY